MVQFASYLRRVLRKTRLIFPRINGPNDRLTSTSAAWAEYHVLSVQRSLLRDQSQASVVQRLDSAIHRINLYPVDSVICFPNTYPLDSDLSDR